MTECQPLPKKMSQEQWSSWQEFIRISDISEHSLHVLLVFLAIRGLAKSDQLKKRLGLSEWASHSDVLNALIDAGLVTSAPLLGEEGLELLLGLIQIHETFNLPQFL